MVKTLIDKLRKGWRNTKLILTAVGAIGLASCTEQCTPIPINNAPEITSIPTTQVNEGSAYNYDVDATDIDGDKLTYSLLLVPPWLSINSNTGLISGVAPEVDSDIPYDIGVGVSDGISPIVTQNYTLTVKNVVVPPEDYLDVEGWLQDNESDTGKQGTIRIYDSLENLIGETQADSNGHFVFNSPDKKVSDVSGGVIIQARSGTNPSWTSYVRTINANVNSASEPDVIVNPIRVVPYPAFDCSYGGISSNDNFKTFMNQIDFYSENEIAGLARFDLSQIQGIEILLKNLDDSKNWDTNPDNGWHYSADPSNLKTKILNNGVADYIEGGVTGESLYVYIDGEQRIIPIQIETSPNSQDNYDSTGSPNPGWIIVVPDKTLGGGRTYFGYLNDTKLSGLINRVIIGLTEVNDAIPTHEFGHAFIGSNSDYDGHCNIPPFYNGPPPAINTLTMMTPSNLKLPPPGVADVKASHIIYEDTYLPREKLNDILRDNFLP